MSTALDFSGVQLGEIKTTLHSEPLVDYSSNTPIHSSSHVLLMIQATAYEELVSRWNELYTCEEYCSNEDSHCDDACTCGWKCDLDHPGYEVPGEVLAAASTAGLMLEHVARRLRTELRKESAEHDPPAEGGRVDPKGDRCGVRQVATAGPRTAKGWHERFEYARTVRIRAFVPAEHARMWQRDVELWLEESVTKLRLA